MTMKTSRAVQRASVLASHICVQNEEKSLDNCSATAGVIDFRSDTVTKPTREMRQAMFDSLVGDDVYGDDPTVNKLEELTAKFLGKEAALFVPSGTMGNLISCMAHCEARNSEMVVGSQCHIHLYEAGGTARFGGIHARVIPNLPDGTMDLDLIENTINPNLENGNPHFTACKLICIENTHNRSGGVVVPLEYMEKVRKLADKHKLKVHLDGARLCNAAIQLGVHPRRVARDVDTVNICFSKGLAAPVGSAIAGTKEFIQKARALRKCLGGGMRQAGVLAACAIISLEKMYPRLVEDHKNALTLAEGLSKIPHITVHPFDTNIVFLDVHCDKLESVNNGADVIAKLNEAGILANNTSGNTLRLVCHYEISQQDVEDGIKFFENLK